MQLLFEKRSPRGARASDLCLLLPAWASGVNDAVLANELDEMSLLLGDMLSDFPLHRTSPLWCSSFDSSAEVGVAKREWKTATAQSY